MTIASTRFIQGNTFEIQTPGFKVLTDTQASLGGNDIAPNPHDYLEIALAGCTAMTIQMYAKRKQIPLTDVNVRIRITAEGQTNEITRDISLSGDLSQEQKDMLIAIANKCPVHKFLERGATIHTTAV